jgi:hypothetical protein
VRVNHGLGMHDWVAFAVKHEFPTRGWGAVVQELLYFLHLETILCSVRRLSRIISVGVDIHVFAYRYEPRNWHAMLPRHARSEQ